jgi:hypothetical protein
LEESIACFEGVDRVVTHTTDAEVVDKEVNHGRNNGAVEGFRSGGWSCHHGMVWWHGLLGEKVSTETLSTATNANNCRMRKCKTVSISRACVVAWSAFNTR